MGDIAQRGNRLTAAKGGRIGKFGGGRTNLLEELGRVEAEPSNRNRRAEISRVHGELNRGYKTGGRVKKAVGGWTLRKPVQKLLEGIGGGSEGKPHSTQAGRISAGVRKIKRGAKSWNKKINKMAKDAHLGRPFMKVKKEKDWADPSETVGGRRIQTKGGPELIPPKRKDDVGVGGYQEPLKNIKRPAGLGAALRGGGRAFMKGGKVK